jgi:A/G-specific adenine glycosylase
VEKWPAIKDLANANEDEVLENWAGLGYYSRARNLYKCAKIIVDEYLGLFPETQSELKKLPGIGDYTSAAIRSIAYDKQSVVIDGNVERVISRIYKIEDPLPNSKKIIFKHAEELSLSLDDKHSSFAQSMMDLGALICIPKSPRCQVCPLQDQCLSKILNLQHVLPKKKQKTKQIQKYGYIYAFCNEDNEILCEKRTHYTLFKDMIGLPTSEWDINRQKIQHIELLNKAKNINQLEEFCEINHVFTHFKLKLKGFHISVRKKDIELNNEQFWVLEKDLEKRGLPTLFKKFVIQLLDNSIEG